MKRIIIDNISTSYFITENGKCFNSKTGKYLKGQENYKNHYISYNLTLPDGTKKRCYAHRLVAIAYLPNPENKTEVNHKNGKVQENYIDNLEWVTPKKNSQHALDNELRVSNHVYCFNKDKELIAEYKSVKNAAHAVNISESLIMQEVNKTIKTLTGGFYWSYERELGETKNYPNSGRAKVVVQYDLNGKYINKYESTGQAARSLGIANSSHIGECCRGKIKTYKGFIWRYIEDIV